ncbi:efflux RND transporter periplasmic adaptor subunit [Melioribacter sp. Ez-97]|jgi:RND family efflux transporter MFP subunit|uniref:efflux RND transporter periplasmic adaptor subunit n=1 Tax=Melioribacter sp. Ez-97 TaxID=3423434 RepID=UPI003ED9C6FF
MKSNRIFAALLLLLFVGFAGCSSKKEEVKENKPIPVEVTRVETTSIEREIELVGTLQPWKEANLGAQTTGRVEKIFVEEGTYVKEGDLLFQMDDTQLIQAKLQYQLAKDNYERMKPLYESGSISQSQFDQVKANYESAEKSYNLLLTNTQFRAPFSGVVTAKKLNEGEIFLLAPTGGAPSIITIMQLNPLKLTLGISESDFNSVKTGQTVVVKSDIYPDREFKGVINRINPAINPATRTFQAEVKVPNDNNLLRPGMFVRASVKIGSKEGIIVNRSAALKQLGSDAYYGFIVKNNTAKRVELKLGKEFNSVVEIVSGLSEGDYLVTKGQGLLKDGSAVEIKAKAE